MEAESGIKSVFRAFMPALPRPRRGHRAGRAARRAAGRIVSAQPRHARGGRATASR
jgi:hypothetical protein